MKISSRSLKIWYVKWKKKTNFSKCLKQKLNEENVNFVDDPVY